MEQMQQQLQQAASANGNTGSSLDMSDDNSYFQHMTGYSPSKMSASDGDGLMDMGAYPAQ
jgi:hypothetical protein